ncbi:HmuY family protein [Paenimyroides ceti]
MKSILKIIAVLSLVFTLGCEKDNEFTQEPFVVAFKSQSIDYSTIQDNYNMRLVFSEPAKAAGKVYIRVSEDNASQGIDYTTIPQQIDRIIELPFNNNDTEVSFVFENLIYPFDREDKMITFKIEKVDYSFATAIQGYSTAVISFGRTLGAVLEPEIGGPNQAYNVYVDLSTERMTKIKRDSWDLGFYSGNLNRVTINGSIYMAAKKLETTDMNAVTQASVQSMLSEVAVGTFDAANANYVDDPSGDIQMTAISEISSDNSQNFVYLVNLGFQPGTETPPTGSVAVSGTPRGFKKMRILLEGDNYVLQYADLNETTFKTVKINRTPSHNFTHFSFTTNNIVEVEPAKDKWDLNFTVFTDIIDGSGSYGYSDFVINNLKAGVKVYKVSTGFKSYEAFSEGDIQDNLFVQNQGVIGVDWRNVFDKVVHADRYYILKDIEGNYFKIRMLQMLNNNGERGFPKFEYQLIK